LIQERRGRDSSRDLSLKLEGEILGSILTSSPDAITVSDLNGSIVECNRATLDMHGFSSKNELLGKNALELIAKKDHGRALENLKKTLAQGSMQNVEYTLVAKDGREFPAELSASVIRDSSGKPINFVATTKDITERKRLEEELRRSGQFLKSALDNIPDTVFIKDRDFRYTLVNKACYELLGRSRDEFLGRTDYDLFPKEMADLYRKTDMEVFEKGSAIDIPEVAVTDASGSTRIHHVKKAPLKDAKGIVAHLIGITRDVTERKSMEEAMRRQTDLLQNTFDSMTDAVLATHSCH